MCPRLPWYIKIFTNLYQLHEWEMGTPVVPISVCFRSSYFQHINKWEQWGFFQYANTIHLKKIVLFCYDCVIFLIFFVIKLSHSSVTLYYLIFFSFQNTSYKHILWCNIYFVRIHLCANIWDPFHQMLQERDALFPNDRRGQRCKHIISNVQFIQEAG